MICLFTGTPGSGKSLHVAQIISDTLRYKDMYVVTNIPVNLNLFKKNRRDRYYYYNNSELTPGVLKNVSKSYFDKHGGKIKEDKILVIIDEAQLLFNARTWNAQGRSEWNEFFTIHRHLGLKIILVCQFDQMLDKQIRYLVEYQYIHRKLTNFGWRGWLLILLSAGRRFSCVKYWYPIREKLGLNLFYCNRRFFKIYDTYMLFDSKI